MYYKNGYSANKFNKIKESIAIFSSNMTARHKNAMPPAAHRACEQTRTENENFAANRTKDPAYFESNETEKRRRKQKKKIKKEPV